METLASALREYGFDVVVSTGSFPNFVAAVEVILILAGEPLDRLITAINNYRAIYSNAILVLVGADYHERQLLALIEAGMHTYASSSASLDDLVQTIKAVHRGEIVCPPQLGALVVARIAELEQSQNPSNQPGLTAREQQILRLVAAGLCNKEIGHQLSISLHTVKIHVHRILEKLQVRRRAEAARWIQAQSSAGAYNLRTRRDLVTVPFA
jgi:DNA-binding NarL/FixJ family response regulator